MREFKPGIYRHYKNKEYEALFTAKNSDTLEDMIVYKALYGECLFWVRPLSEFMIEIDDNSENILHQKYRFEFIKEN